MAVINECFCRACRRQAIYQYVPRCSMEESYWQCRMCGARESQARQDGGPGRIVRVQPVELAQRPTGRIMGPVRRGDTDEAEAISAA